MSKGKVIAAVLVVVVVAGAGVAIALGAQARVVEVSVEEAVQGTLSVTVSASGRIEADEKGDIYPPTAGTLASIAVTDGQSVEAGDLIATLEMTPLELQVAQAQAAYAAALAQADAINKTAPSSADKTAASAGVSAAYSAYQAAAAQYEAIQTAVPSQAALDQAQTQVDQAQAAYDAASQAYDDFATANPAPRDPITEAALAALGIIRDQAYGNLLSAQAALGQLLAAQNNDAAAAAAKAAKDQAWAAYLAALSQQSQLDKASNTGAARSSADAGVAAARRALDYAIENLDKAELRAPMAGTVVFNSATGGLSLGGGSGAGKPTVGSAVSPASAPFSVVYFDRLLFNAQVDEADIAKIKEGQSSTVILDALSGETFETAVERIGKTSALTPTGGTAFPVLIRLRDAGDTVLLGMNGSVDIEIDTVQNAITVPVEAVLDDVGESYVFVIRDGKAHRVLVTLGRLTETRAQILKGVVSGDQVAVSGLTELEDGMTVRVK